MIQTGFGVVNSWECDENDHLNVQYYSSAMHEADGHLRLALGLSPTNYSDTDYMVRVENDHIRYHAELREVDRFHVESAITAIGGTTVNILHTMINTASGELAASMTSVWRCINPGSGAEQPWPENIRQAPSALQVEIPDFATRRSAGVNDFPVELRMDDRRLSQVPTTQMGVVGANECDADGLMTTTGLFRRFGTAAAHTWGSLGLGWRELNDRNHGTVVLENFIAYHQPIPLGTAFVIKSFIRETSRKSAGFQHAVFDAQSSQLVARSEVTAVLFDLESRRAIEFSAQERATIEAAVIEF